MQNAPRDNFIACTRALPADAVFETSLAKADVILVLGNKEKGASRILAARAAMLFHAGYAPHIIASGGVVDDDGLMEAWHIRTQLLALDVPPRAIYCETHSTNTCENITFSKKMALRLPNLPRHPRVIAIGQRFASRRIAMTMAAQWPEATAMIATVCMIGKPLHEWHTHPHAVHCMTREIQKMPEYMAKGDIAPIVPDAIHRTLRALAFRDKSPRPQKP